MPRNPLTGLASIHTDDQHPDFAYVVVWSSRGNMKADQRLTRDGVAELQLYCARWLADHPATKTED